MKVPKRILPIIILSQFLCTSLWFAGNGVMSNLILEYNLASQALGYLTSSVQFGFIVGTLTFAFFTIVDRFSPSKVFFVSALLGGLINLFTTWEESTLISLVIVRFFTGFFLAGIYPVGMKIAADYYDKKLGKSLGFLVGALVLGTALPHLLKNITSEIPWENVVYLTSLFAFVGGLLLVILVKDGPFRKTSQKFDITVFSRVFANKKLKSAAFGYFGHMWELYAFWTFVPVILETYYSNYNESISNVSILSFIIIALGFISCSIGGYISLKTGAKKVALISLLISGVCCLFSPIFFQLESEFIFILFLSLWGMTVISDSPMFSTMVAKNADSEIKGTALTLVNCIGFAITIVSIQMLSLLSEITPIYAYLILAVGPVFGLISIKKEV